MASSLTQPNPITVPFAESGSKRTVPTASQIGITDGKASYADGFPPLCATPLASGGKPPSIMDMNGILNAITANLRFLLGGGIPKFSPALASAIGGYPLGAVLQDDARENIYQNVVDGNSTNFNSFPASIGVSWKQIADTDWAALIASKAPLDNPTFSTGVASSGPIIAINAAVRAKGWNGVATDGVYYFGSGESYIQKIGNLFAFAIHNIGVAYMSKPGTVAMLDDISVFLPKRSFTANDFIRIPDVEGGLIFQFGTITAISTDGTSASISFPMTFPHAVFGIITSHVSSGVDGNPVSSCSVKSDYTTSSFKLMQDTAKGSGVNEFWIAIGW